MGGPLALGFRSVYFFYCLFFTSVMAAAPPPALPPKLKKEPVAAAAGGPAAGADDDEPNDGYKVAAKVSMGELLNKDKVSSCYLNCTYVNVRVTNH